MANLDFIKLKQRVDELIRNGNAIAANDLLSTVKTTQLSKEDRPSFSALARRLNQPELALKVLWKQVYGGNKASTEEVLECANALRVLGVSNQALKLLKNLPESYDSQKSIAFSHIHRWEYKEAANHLLNSLNFKDLTERQTDLAKVNLAGCYVFGENYEQAEKILFDLQKSELKDRNWLLWANTLELQSQIQFSQGRLEEAQKLLNSIRSESKNPVPFIKLFIDKWDLLISLSKGDIYSKDKAITEFYKEIRSLGHWETLRHFDFHLANLTNETQLLNYVYFGTPYVQFREKFSEKKKHLDSSFT